MALDQIALTIRAIPKSAPLTVGEIGFAGVCIIDGTLNGVPLLDDPRFAGSLMVNEELLKSCDGPGSFLIYTCACGIADDAGWKQIEVTHHASTIAWTFTRGEEAVQLTFDKQAYREEVRKLQQEIASAPFPLEPSHVIFPDHH